MIKKTLFFSTPAYLSLRNKQLVIRVQGDDNMHNQEKTRPIEDIGVIIVESQQVTLTSALISYLLSNNVALVTCDEHHLPVGLMLNLVGNTLQSERFQSQISASQPLRKQLWQQTVQAKIRNQSRALEVSTGEVHGCMNRWAERVKSGDGENVEGRAAAYYWKNFFATVTKFKRDRYGEATNQILNYGYIVLRAIVARALVGSGLLPTLGIHHHNRYNAYCLADDIMEPYRPFVDLLVRRIIKIFGCDASLDKEVKKELLSIPIIDVMIDGRRSPLMVAVSQTTSSLAKCFLGEHRKIIYPTIADFTLYE